jgi:hypothetical protein
LASRYADNLPLEDNQLELSLTMTIPQCLSRLLQVDSEPEKAILSFYHIFKGYKGSSFRTILRELKASEGGKREIFRLYELIALQTGDADKEELLDNILQALGSKEVDPLGRFDAMFCLRFKAGDDEWSAKQLKEHVAYCYDYFSHEVDSRGYSTITREDFKMLTDLSKPYMFNHGESSKLLACLISEDRLPTFESENEIVMELGDKVLYGGADEASRKIFAIALFQKAVEQQFDHEVKKATYFRQEQV